MAEKFRSGLIFFIGALLVISACSNTGKISTARKLAEALKKEGTNFQTMKESPPSLRKIRYPGTGKEIKVDEIIDLMGNNLFIELTRINNKDSYRKVRPIVGVSLAMTEAIFKDPKGSAHAYLKYPFMILVVKEPQEGNIKSALGNIFPKAAIEEMKASENDYKIIEDFQAKIKQMFPQENPPEKKEEPEKIQKKSK